LPWTLAASAGLAVVYVAAAKLGLLMDAVSGFATLVWPAAGIALVALLRLGIRVWPGVFVGAFAVNLWTGAPVAVALGIAAGNTLEAIGGAWALRHFTGMRDRPTRVSEAVGFIALAAAGSTLVSAVVGTASLRLGGVISAGALVETWRAWWLGDATGELVTAPLLLAWSVEVRSLLRAPPRRIVEAVALAGALAAAAFFVFAVRGAADRPFGQPYLVFPILIWASLRFDLRGATAATFALSVIAVWATARGQGPFVHARLATSLVFLQVFMAVVSVTALMLAVATAERDRAVKAREWMLAAVSHDLKNPLNVVGLGTDYVARLLPDNDGTRRQVANLRAATQRMEVLVRDLLDLSSIEAGHFSIARAPTAARTLVDEALESSRALAEAKSQSLHATIAQSEPTASCDRGRVLQVLVNLLDNAIKFSPEKSPINITVDGDERWVRFTVTDVGPGIAPAEAARVFEPFWRAADTRKPGTGLGLAIAKAIVDAHGGRIWVSSRSGSGASFSFSLPAAGSSHPF
jgi:signal transduction histidine kinase